MAVVRNLMIRIGADYSQARKAMQGAQQDLGRFKRDVTRTTRDVAGRRGLAGVNQEIRELGSTVASSFGRIRGAKGVGGVVSELNNLRPAMSEAVKGLRGLGVASVTTGSRFGLLGIAIGAVVAALALAVAGLAQASQAAVKFEADLGRLNMQLGKNSRSYIEWARAQGLAKQTSVEMGATYSTLLSSFIRNNDELAAQTKRFVQTTRVVASATGRDITDVTERMRSGLLGNTEAIEDLGIFVNVSMIESTKAFRKFAGDKSWDQLDFNVQQQIRLAAILEQAYNRYGDTLQNNVMSKQTRLTELLKDVKLNLSQAFLPIWDSVLPALIRLGESLAHVTEQLARFSYWLRGWDYDERTQGTDQAADAVNNLGDAYQETGKQAAAARKEIAAFDRLNLIGSGSGSGGTGGSGGGGSGGNTPGGPGGGGGNDWPLPELPAIPRLQLKFDMPSPPDAGIGAVATVVVSTVESLIANLKLRWSQMWADLQAQTLVSTPVISGQWATMLSTMQANLATAAPSLQTQMANMFAGIKANSTETSTQVRTSWKTTLAGMVADLVAHRPAFESGWYNIRYYARLTVSTLTDVRAAWKQRLSEMYADLNAYRPLIEYGWVLIRQSVRNTIPTLSDVKAAWSGAMSDMQSATINMAATVAAKIGQAIDALNRLKSALGQKVTVPTVTPAPAPAPVTHPGLSGSLSGYLGTTFGPDTWRQMGETLQNEWNKPANQVGLTIMGLFTGGTAARGALAGAGKVADDALKKLAESLKGLGISVPAFGNGGAVFGPTLAMVGDNHGAAYDPEIIAPASAIEDLVGGDNREMVGVMRQILRAVERGQNVSVSISQSEVGRAAANHINEEARRGRNPLPAL